MAGQRKNKDAKKLLATIRERYKVMSDADSTNRSEAADDLRFVNVVGAQWDKNMTDARGDRPCYEFNKLRINGKRVINEIRANRPQGKVRAVEGGDKKTAELYEGLCRNIANISDFDTIVDQAAEYQVDAGMGAWRVTTEYAGDDVFDQDILIKPIKNPFCLYVDPSCQDAMKRDAADWILTEKISKATYESKYPKAQKVDFEDEGDFDDDEWEDEDTVRICEYWYKEPYDKEIWLIQGDNGPITVDSTSDEAEALAKQGVRPIKTRMAKCNRIMMCIVSGDAVLEGPVEWAGSQFPFVMVYGEYKIIEGKVKWWGLHRFARDAQQSYNVSRTAIDETIATAPKSYFWATPKQAEGLTAQWARAHQQNMPFRLYNADDKAPGAPVTIPGAQVPAALIEQAMIASQDIRDVTGLHEASFGEESDEKSGVALARKQSQASVVTYNFPDNIAKAVRRTWEIMIDLIPEVYDAERELRVLGADGAEDYAKVNQIVIDPQTQKAIRVNDLTAGKYDVTVTVGPSFSTLRQEGAEFWSEIGAKVPQVWAVAGDLIMKSMDTPYSDEFAKRFTFLLPPPIQQQLAEGKDIPPEAMAVLAQAEQMKQMVAEQSQLVTQAAQEAEQEKSAADKAKADVQVALANLKTAEAQFEAKVAKTIADFQNREAQLGMKGMELDGKAKEVQGQQEQVDRQAGEVSEGKQAVAEIRDAAGEFFAQAQAIMKQMQARPKVTEIVMERAPGKKPRAIPIYEESVPVQ